MKSMLLRIATFLLLAGVVSAGVKEDVERAQKAAVSSGKLIAFVFLQDYWDPGCPTCVAQVSTANASLKKIAPNKYAKVVYLEPKDLKKEDRDGSKGSDALPECIRSNRTAGLFVTDADCTTVVARAQTAADSKKIREEKKRLNDVCAEYLETGEVPAGGDNK